MNTNVILICSFVSHHLLWTCVGRHRTSVSRRLRCHPSRCSLTSWLTLGESLVSASSAKWGKICAMFSHPTMIQSNSLQGSVEQREHPSSGSRVDTLFPGLITLSWSLTRVVFCSLGTRKISPPLLTLHWTTYPVGLYLKRKLFLRIIMAEGF